MPHYGTQAICRVPKTHGKARFAHDKGFAVCSTRQPSVGKGLLCRGFFVGHTAKLLPCAKRDSRQKKGR